ncbi:hypothetical protein TH5_08860 [Thalassospira xianhensis MCCC 1A02616]|uniref:SHSP domain-containing protein n=2 Tax=Thalassospira xianhensis TaxID=478503 RepID=A0A367UF52_9PROT|nr:hypothetical protein TH5_08860 [Thalassospira xianhensis MCCC 1A02616]
MGTFPHSALIGEIEMDDNITRFKRAFKNYTVLSPDYPASRFLHSLRELGFDGIPANVPVMRYHKDAGVAFLVVDVPMYATEELSVTHSAEDRLVTIVGEPASEPDTGTKGSDAVEMDDFQLLRSVKKLTGFKHDIRIPADLKLDSVLHRNGVLSIKLTSTKPSKPQAVNVDITN